MEIRQSGQTSSNVRTIVFPSASAFQTDAGRNDMHIFVYTEEHFSVPPGHVQITLHHHIKAARMVKME